MQTSEAIAPNVSLSADADSVGRAGVNLVLYPGEPSDLMMGFENASGDRMILGVRVDGNISPTWYQIRLDRDDLLPHQHMEGILRFQVPDSFFENDISSGLSNDSGTSSPHPLDYRIEITVTYQQESHQGYQRHLEQAGVNLFVRPRTQLMEFLPALYREVDFMHRYMQIFEKTLRPIFEAADALPHYFNPLTAPSALLPFLAHWMGWHLDELPLMPSDQRRLIRSAMDIYRWRGTRRGLRLFLHYITGLPLEEHLLEGDRAISIQEASNNAFTLGIVQLGADATLGKCRPYHFIVTLRPPPDIALSLPLIHQIIAQEKPAHCSYDLVIQPKEREEEVRV
jgi:phage tail-like protein